MLSVIRTLLNGWAPFVDGCLLVGGWVWSLKTARRIASRSAVIVAVFPVLCVGSCSTPGLGSGRRESQEGDGPRPPVRVQGLQAEGLISKQVSTFAFYLYVMVSLPLTGPCMDSV